MICYFHASAFPSLYSNSYCSNDSFVTDDVFSNLRGKMSGGFWISMEVEALAQVLVPPTAVKGAVLPTQASMAGVMTGKGLCHWTREH